MIVLLLFVILFNVIFCLPAWIWGRKRVCWYKWDYGVCVYPIVVWVVMVNRRIGEPASLANFVLEVFWIFIASTIVPYLRLMVGVRRFKKNNALISALLLLIPVAAGILLRLLMPTLPE